MCTERQTGKPTGLNKVTGEISHYWSDFFFSTWSRCVRKNISHFGNIMQINLIVMLSNIY